MILLRYKKTVIPVAILLLGTLICYFLLLSKPIAVRKDLVSNTMKVNTVVAKRGDYPAYVSGTAKVKAAQQISLQSQVAGTVASVSTALTPGHIVEKGVELLQLDKHYYINQLQKYKAKYQQAQAAYNIERGQQKVAQHSVDSLASVTGTVPENIQLMTRQPQLNHAAAAMKIAKLAVEMAEKDLADTTIKAPFNAMVLEKKVNVANVVAKYDSLASLVGIDQYWLELLVPKETSTWILPHKATLYATVYLANATISGYVLKVVRALDNNSSMMRVLIAVDDPLQLRKNILHHEVATPNNILMLGDYVKVQVNGHKIKDVIRLSRSYLHDNNTVWLLEDDKLTIKKVTIKFKDSDYIYIDSGINSGEKVITTDVGVPIDHMKVIAQE